MARKQAYTRRAKVEAGKPAETLLQRLSEEEFRNLCKSVALFIRASGMDTDSVAKGIASPTPTNGKTVLGPGQPPATAPYKDRLQAIYTCCVELFSKQESFANYLAPQPGTDAATAASPPHSIDELLSSIEYLLCRSHTMVDNLRSQF